jgi:hypothetical protein
MRIDKKRKSKLPLRDRQVYEIEDTKENPGYEVTEEPLLVYPFIAEVHELEGAAKGFREAEANPLRAASEHLMTGDPVFINEKDYRLLTEMNSWWTDSLINFWMKWYVLVS